MGKERRGRRRERRGKRNGMRKKGERRKMGNEG